MEACRELERPVAGVLRRKLQVQLHRHRNLVLKVEVVGPERLCVGRRLEAERDLRHVLRIHGAANLERHDSRETVGGHPLYGKLAELRPADGYSAMQGFAAVVVALLRTEDDRAVARRPVREHVRAEKRDLGRAELVGEHHFGIAREAGAENDSSWGAIAPVEFIYSHQSLTS